MVILGLGGAPVFFDPDTAWHLAAGDLIRTAHRIPFADSWSYTAEGEIWYNLSWLFDLGLSALFRIGSFSAVYAATIITFAACIAFMATHCIRRGADHLSVLLLLFPVAMVVFTGTLARPNMCSVVLTLTFYLLLQQYRVTGKLFYLAPLPVLMALWVNLHGGFLFAFVLFALFMLPALLDKDRRMLREYGMIAALCLLATLVNPYGFGIYYGAYRTLAAPFSHMLIEWEPVEVGHNLPVTLLLAIFLCTANLTDKKIPLPDRVLALFVILLSLSSLRHSILASILLMPYLSLRLSAIAATNPSWKRIEHAIAGDMQKHDIRALAWILAAAGCLLMYSPYPRDAILKEPAGFPAKRFPAAEAAYVVDRYPQTRFFTDYNIGGYLDYLWRGRVKVFVDGRANSLYSDTLLADYKDFAEYHGFGGKAHMVEEKYGFNGLIIANEEGKQALWDWNPEWKLVYRGKAASVYIRQKQ
ncbi:MAG TPA: hypothetical protein VFT64_03830 [Rickettsiales bacterium]|nr:hypothetical protein [Rickettsiales bacterium]